MAPSRMPCHCSNVWCAHEAGADPGAPPAHYGGGGCACPAAASASLSGTVLDESSAVAPAAAIEARDEATGFTYRAITGPEGAYVIAQLPPGLYTVTVTKPGFRVTTSGHVLLTVDQRARLDLKLFVGTERESITATAAVSPVQSEESSIGYRLDAVTTGELPLDTRNIVALVTLGPGAIPRQLGGFTHDVVNDVQQGSRGSVAFNPPINGSRSTMNAFVLDGAYDTDRNTFAIAVYPPMESVEELRVQTSSLRRNFRKPAAAPSMWSPAPAPASSMAAPSSICKMKRPTPATISTIPRWPRRWCARISLVAR